MLTEHCKVASVMQLCQGFAPALLQDQLSNSSIDVVHLQTSTEWSPLLMCGWSHMDACNLAGQGERSNITRKSLGRIKIKHFSVHVMYREA